MNVVFYLYQYPAIGGIEAVTALLAGRLAARGYVVSIISHVGKSDRFSILDMAKDIPVYRMPERTFYSKRNRDFLQAKLRELDADVVIFQDSYAQIEGNLFVRDLKSRVIVCEHNSPYNPAYYFSRKLSFGVEILRRLRFRWLMMKRHYAEVRRHRFLYDRCARYVLLSDRFFGEFRALTRLLDSRKLLAIPNPVTAAVQEGILKENRIVFVGTVDARKGSDYVASIFKELARKYPEWEFDVVGDGPERQRVERELGGLANVHLWGYQPDASRYFAAAKIFVFPSRREGWGLVLIEAMANGCVPVCFDSYAAVRDIVEDGRNGELVPAFDEGRMIQRIEELMGTRDRLARMAELGREFVKRFDADLVIDRWEALLREMDVAQ